MFVRSYAIDNDLSHKMYIGFILFYNLLMFFLQFYDEVIYSFP